MEILDVVSSMRSRMPWEVAQRVFEEQDVPRGHGWEKTVAKVRQHPKAYEASLDGLAASLRGHFLGGEKFVRFYRLSDEEMEALRVAVLQLEVAKTPFSEAYPILLGQEAIQKNFPTAPHLVAIEKGEDGVGAVFSSTRAVQLREPLEISDLSPAAAEALSEYDELVGVKLVKLQAMDTVWVPHDGNFVDIRIDFPKGMQHDLASAAALRVGKEMSDRVQQNLFSSPVNLFPLIQQMYAKPKEGNVVELAFGTTTASLKHEKMRRGNLCLREEIYHRAGKAALAVPIEPYRLSIQWSMFSDGKLVSRPELSFNGSSRLTGVAEPLLHEAIIRRCAGIADYEDVRSRIEGYLTPLPQADTTGK